MKVDNNPPIIVAYVPKPKAPEKTVEVAKASPEVEAAMREYVKRIGAQVLSGVPLATASADPRLTVGAPVSINQHTELLPLFGIDIFDANAATEHMSAISEALEAPSMNGAQLLKLGDHASALLEQLPNPPTGVGIGFHVIGLVRTLPRAAAALTKPGSKKTVEVGKAVFPFFAALGQLVTDIPGMEHGKPYAESLSWVAKAGEQFFTVPVSRVPASPVRSKVAKPTK
jgi:hypothetical protein